MGGITKLQKCQMGLEGTPGVAAAISTLWRGPIKWSDKRSWAQSKEDIGLFWPGPRVHAISGLGQITFEPTEATFEQLPYILTSGVKALVTGVADGGGTGKIYAYPFPVSAANTLSSYTFEIGDNQRQDQGLYGMVESFELKGAGKEALKMQAVWNTRELTDVAFTAAPALPSVEEILFSMGKLYINNTGGTIGTTQATTTWLGIDIKVNSGNNQIWTGDGLSAFSFVKNIGPMCTGILTLEHDSFGEAEVAAARANAVRLIRMKWLGSALTTPGTAHTYKTLQFDAAIVYDSVPDVTSQDGDDTVALPWHIVNSDSIVPTFTVVNQLVALP